MKVGLKNNMLALWSAFLNSWPFVSLPPKQDFQLLGHSGSGLGNTGGLPPVCYDWQRLQDWGVWGAGYHLTRARPDPPPTTHIPSIPKCLQTLILPVSDTPLQKQLLGHRVGKQGRVRQFRKVECSHPPAQEESSIGGHCLLGRNSAMVSTCRGDMSSGLARKDVVTQTELP